MKYTITLLVVVLCALGMGFATAQDNNLPGNQKVQTEAEDGLLLVGDFYPVVTDSDQAKPTFLLLHMIGSNRESWLPLVSSLWEADYSVLAVDLRGFGDTGGEINWSAATTDVQTWIDWLRHQPEVHPDAISI